MSNLEAGDVEYEDDDLGPSLALPPLYVLRSADCCPECGLPTHLYMLGCAAYHDAEERKPVEEFHFLRRIRRLPDTLSELLKARCPGYYADADAEGEPPYLMNHCPCGERLDDDFVCGDVGAAFWPDTPEGYRRFKLFRLPINAPIPVECACMTGGGEYLNFAGAGEW